ncbi:hypothetical protein J4479_02410 [Candidatus Woesearchaeota archaeon]|nr:hypothetical protein [Candidatus Woesearchaeota archaeon]
MVKENEVVLEEIKVADADNNQGLVQVIGKDAQPRRVFFTTRLIAGEKETVFGIIGNYWAWNYTEYAAARESFLRNVTFYIHNRRYKILGSVNI